MSKQIERKVRARGTGRVYRHPLTGGLYVSFSYRGRQVSLSVAKHAGKDPSRVTEQDAERLLRQKLGEAQVGKYLGPAADRLTVKQLAADYRRHLELKGAKTASQACYRAKWNRIQADLGHMRIPQLATPTLERWVKELLDDEYAPGTVNVMLGMLGAALSYGRRCDIVAGAPYLPRLRVNNARQGFFEREQIAAVIAALPDPLDDMTRFGYLTGWRVEEIAGLTWSQVDRKQAVIAITDTKNGDGRTVPVVGELARLLEHRWARRALGVPWVFHRASKRVKRFNGAWRAACRTAGVEGRVFHDLRRTAVRDLVRAGVPESVAMSISGHRSRSMFSRYNISSERDRAEALTRLDAYREDRQKADSRA